MSEILQISQPIEYQPQELLDSEFTARGFWEEGKLATDGVWKIRPGIFVLSKVTRLLKQGYVPDFGELRTLAMDDSTGDTHVITRKEAKEWFNWRYDQGNWQMVEIMQTRFLQSDYYAELKVDHSGFLPFITEATMVDHYARIYHEVRGD